MKRLTEFDVVTVNVPFEARHARMVEMFDARVLAIVGPTAALEAVDDIDVQRLPERVTGALLSFRKDGALVGLKGRLTTRKDNGDLRFTVVDGVQLNRRSATRVKVSLTMHLHKLGTLEARPGRSVDLSADGVLVETSLRVTVGDAVQVTVTIGPDAPPIESTAHVVRQDSGLVALQFAPSDAVARSQLARFVVEHNRQQLRTHEHAHELVEF